MLIPCSIPLVLSNIVCLALAAKNPKRGLAFAEGKNGNDIKMANTSSSVISWQYDWGAISPDYLQQSGISYVPMLWGRRRMEDFVSSVKKQGSKVVLGFNEPDFVSQSNLSPVEAAKLWRQYIQPLGESGVRLGAPAVTSAPNGRVWLEDFLKACSDCRIDFIPLHWYGTGIGAFLDYLWSFHYQFPNWPLWVTEYASTSSDLAEVSDFMNSTIRYMDALDWIERYAWFAFFRKESGLAYSEPSTFWCSAIALPSYILDLLDEHGNLAPIGKLYIDA